MIRNMVVYDYVVIYDLRSPILGFSIYTVLLYIAASAVILSLVLILMNRFIPILRYRNLSRGNISIFTGVSERGLLLAEDIRCQEKTRKSVIVFLSDKKTKEYKKEYLKRIHAVSGCLLIHDVDKLPIPRGCRQHRIDYFLLQEADSENIRHARKLVQKYENSEKKVYVHVLSDKPEAEFLLDSMVLEEEHNQRKSSCQLRLIQESRSMLYQLVDTKPLFLGARENNLNILIVGAGHIGREAVKACSWCGNTIRLRPNILVVDQLAQSLEQLKFECPESVKQRVRFELINVQTVAFLDLLREHPEIGYVICALGDDSLNLSTAMKIRSVFHESFPLSEKERELPIINVLLNDDSLYSIGNSLWYDNVTRCVLNPFGSWKDFYTWENITGSYLEGSGLAVHCFYKKLYSESVTEEEILEDYQKLECNRSSSMATALHAKYKAYACLCEEQGMLPETFSWEKHPCELMQKFIKEYLYNTLVTVVERKRRIEQLAILEHRRWCAYVRTLGWSRAVTEQSDVWKKQRDMDNNAAVKLHPYLVEWEELDKETKNRVRQLIWELPEILCRTADDDKSPQIHNKTEKTRLLNFDCGYHEMDFQAILFYKSYPVLQGRKVALAGKRRSIMTYLRQALLLNVHFEENQTEYHVWCDRKTANSFRRLCEEMQENIIFHEGVPLEKYLEDMDFVVWTEEQSQNQRRVKELREQLIMDASHLNEYYKQAYQGADWSCLEVHMRAARIATAAFMPVLRQRFQKGDTLDNLARLEHKMWCYFYYLSGWSYGENRDDRRRKHNCLIPYEKLPEEEKEIYRRYVDIGLRML